jgi:hypothetical protein
MLKLNSAFMKDAEKNNSLIFDCKHKQRIFWSGKKKKEENKKKKSTFFFFSFLNSKIKHRVLHFYTQ